MREFPEYYKPIEFTYSVLCGMSVKNARGYLEPQFEIDDHCWFFNEETGDLIDPDNVIDWKYVQ